MEGVVPVFEFGELDGRPFIVSQCITGTSLAKYLDKHRGKIDERHAAALVKAVAMAVHGIHQKDFLHRDIKPANILLEQLDKPCLGELPFRPLVADFGLAKFVESEANSTAFSEASSIIGTLQYMSPEQASGQSKLITVTTDVYSIGTILYEMLTGHPPFTGLTKLALLQKIVDQPAPPMRNVVPRISRELDAIVLKSLSKNPTERYASAEDLAMDLDCFLAGRPTIARPASPPRALFLWANRNPAWAIGLATIWIAMAVLLVGLGVLYGRERRAMHVANETAQLTVGMSKDYYVRLAEELSKKPGNSQEMLKLHHELLSQFQKLAEIRSFDSYSRHQLSIAYNFVASSQERLSMSEAALQSRQHSVQLLKQLVAESPEKVDYRYDLFYNSMLLGWACVGADRENHVNVALSNIRFLIKRKPLSPTYLDAENSLLCQSMFFEEQNNPERSERRAQELIVKTQSLVDKYPDKPLYAKYLYKANAHLGTLASHRNDSNSAKLYFERALNHLALIANDLPTLGERLSEEQHIRTAQVRAFHELHAHEALIECSERFWMLNNDLDKWFPNDDVRKLDHAESKVWVAESLLATKRVDEARTALTEADADIQRVEISDRTKSIRSRYEDSYRELRLLIESTPD